MVALGAVSLAIAWLWLLSPSFAQQISQTPATPAPTPRLVTIATGNKFQELLASSTTGRRTLRILNNNANGDSCWVFVGGGRASKENSAAVLAPGQQYVRYLPFAPSDAIQGTCASSLDTLEVEYQ
jgi:hypothetical protein